MLHAEPLTKKKKENKEKWKHTWSSSADETQSPELDMHIKQKKKQRRRRWPYSIGRWSRIHDEPNPQKTRRGTQARPRIHPFATGEGLDFQRACAACKPRGPTPQGAVAEGGMCGPPSPPAQRGGFKRCVCPGQAMCDTPVDVPRTMPPCLRTSPRASAHGVLLRAGGRGPVEGAHTMDTQWLRHEARGRTDGKQGGRRTRRNGAVSVMETGRSLTRKM